MLHKFSTQGVCLFQRQSHTIYAQFQKQRNFVVLITLIILTTLSTPYFNKVEAYLCYSKDNPSIAESIQRILEKIMKICRKENQSTITENRTLFLQVGIFSSCFLISNHHSLKTYCWIKITHSSSKMNCTNQCSEWFENRVLTGNTRFQNCIDNL